MYLSGEENVCLRSHYGMCILHRRRWSYSMNTSNINPTPKCSIRCLCVVQCSFYFSCVSLLVFFFVNQNLFRIRSRNRARIDQSKEIIIEPIQKKRERKKSKGGKKETRTLTHKHTHKNMLNV